MSKPNEILTEYAHAVAEDVRTMLIQHTRTIKGEYATKEALQALHAATIAALPEYRSDEYGLHDDHTPEQKTRVTAMNRQHNATIDQMKAAINELYEVKG